MNQGFYRSGRCYFFFLQCAVSILIFLRCR
uniref:Uncharacterized protein n=1 Tax=Anguilla anguilla TaxID=7936 RepID=A0A0E9VEJ4_ANGAN